MSIRQSGGKNYREGKSKSATPTETSDHLCLESDPEEISTQQDQQDEEIIVAVQGQETEDLGRMLSMSIDS